MVDSGYHPLRLASVDIILLAPSSDSAWMVDSGYHPLKHHPLRIVLGWWTVDIILLSIILLG